ncbi:transcription factor bHLH30-like [Oryza brachyantha]|uniref:transcription factor bHLH30-like n=1 Tax=Oryza brachyantha TaxID=4533 RepID=UPI001AD999CD|nr:transcription factor bHLH30-like [Oryza brachyantha]
MVTDGECSAAAAVARKGGQQQQQAVVVRSHSEAERKRRQRINAHLATLRTLVPSASRMDKAALLGEVVRHVRELRCRADDATEGVDVVPGEGDEVGVEEEEDAGCYCLPADRGVGDRRWRRRVRAWVCCADRPGLMSDLGRAVRSVSARPVRAEVATVGGRTRSVLELDVTCGDASAAAATDNDRAVALSALRAALRTVLLNREELLAAAAAAEGYKRPRFSPRCST